MATYRSGANARIVLVKESAFNTPGSTGAVVPKSTFTLPGDLELIRTDELTSDVSPARDEKGLNLFDGYQLVSPVSADSFGWPLYFFASAYTPGGTGPYDHEFKLTGDPSSATLEYWDTGISKGDQHHGLYFNSLSISVAKNSEILKATWGAVGSGKKTLDQGTAIDASPDQWNDRRHVLPTCVVKIDASSTAYLTGIDMTLSRPIIGLRPLDGDTFAIGAVLGQFEAEITLRGWMDASANLRGLDDDAEHSVEILSPQPGATGGEEISILFPEAFIYDTETLTVGDSGPAEFSMKVSPIYDNATEATFCEINITNNVATYATI